MNVKSPLQSLQGRLLIASALVLPIVLLIAGLALSKAYNYSVENSVKDRLQLQVYLLLGAVELKDDHIVFPERLQEPRYNQLNSGLYAAIHDQEGQLLWRSLSSILLDDPHLTEAINLGGITTGEPLFQHLPDAATYSFQLRIIWETEGKEHSFLFTVMESDALVIRDIEAYEQQLILWLGIIFLVALLAQTLILSWGLTPLRRLARDLKAIESGTSEKLSGSYPDEVEPVTENLNELIESERKQRERYRNTLGDLAHSLKTPLAVMRGAELEEHELHTYQTLVSEQVERMDQIVQYQLSRAIKSQSKPLGKSVQLAPIVERMLSALNKVYKNKNVHSEMLLTADLIFHGDERDLMEVLGNIMENAFKYGNSQVKVSGSYQNSELKLSICDDGPGVTPEMRQVILQRGARLDTSIQGQGIGLSVATDIISSYQGAIEVTDSPLGGTCFAIRFPD
ncbi:MULTISPECIES: ATP-binding protein [unclassified Neptuniibacter]|uniref:ATP-binding protein n=1 Tax=unclassified Neptuniibacter TaxID=2630693 RepID=UPI000C553217|nr:MULTISPECIES: ATP-binding protein [unclassified Neptuniibacter]MAY43131.1 two-component sensor histidine kinase [Oceanospirillaceae bacterium]